MYKMKLLLVILGLIVAVATKPATDGYEPITVDYHVNYGIPEAARIKAAESAADFDGSRIAGGSLARLGQFPFAGGLLIATPRGQSVCGCSLVSNTRLVTAAHCWNDGSTQASQFTVVLGSITLHTGGHRVNTNQVTMHPSWNPRRITSDVAVIRIVHVGFSVNINRINLASGTNTYAGAFAIAVGFGRKGDSNPIAHNQGKSHVIMPVITNAECRRSYRQVVDSTICTSGANGRSTCRGDSGGPLFISNTLIGITSFGSARGCDRGFPAAFARVTSFYSWFRLHI